MPERSDHIHSKLVEANSLCKKGSRSMQELGWRKHGHHVTERHVDAWKRHGQNKTQGTLNKTSMHTAGPRS